MGELDGRVAIITGAGRGLGREHALLFAREGAKVVVNDLGGERDGTGADATPAEEVVAEIEAMGGEAVVNGSSVSDWDAAGELEPLTTLNRAVLSEIELARPRSHWIRSEDGNRIQVWVLDPVQRKSRGPAVLQIHGGPPTEAWYKEIRIKELAGE